jgi:hypothetical protein
VLKVIKAYHIAKVQATAPASEDTASGPNVHRKAAAGPVMGSTSQGAKRMRRVDQASQGCISRDSEEEIEEEECEEDLDTSSSTDTLDNDDQTSSLSGKGSGDSGVDGDWSTDSEAVNGACSAATKQKDKHAVKRPQRQVCGS